MDLTAKQRWLVRSTYETMIAPKIDGGYQEYKTRKELGAQENTSSLSYCFYEKLFSSRPDMQELFTRFNLLQTVQAINRRLDLPPESMIANLNALGGRHHQYGVRAINFDVIGEVMIDTFKEQLGKSFTPEAAEAWRCAWKVFSNGMKAGGCAASQMEHR